MYEEKATQHHGCEYAGADDEGNLYKDIVAFMIAWLKESIPYIVETIHKIKFSGELLPDTMPNCTDDLTSSGIATDNHTSNLHELSSLATMLNSYSNQYIKHPGNFDNKTYLFDDTVHIMKNIRNNLLNRIKFVFSNLFTTVV